MTSSNVIVGCGVNDLIQIVYDSPKTSIAMTLQHLQNWTYLYKAKFANYEQALITPKNTLPNIRFKKIKRGWCDKRRYFSKLQ